MSLIPLSTAKQWLQIAHTAEDTALQIMLDAVEAEIGVRCGIAFGSASYVEARPAGMYLWMSFNPITALTSITFENGTTDFSTVADYKQGGVATSAIRRTNGCEWYCGLDEYPWKVTYAAGYTQATLPAGLKACVLELLKHDYDARGGQVSNSSGGVSRSWNRDGILMRADMFSFRMGVF